MVKFRRRRGRIQTEERRRKEEEGPTIAAMKITAGQPITTLIDLSVGG